VNTNHEPLYVFGGCRYNIDGQDVFLIYTPFSHKPEAERELIERILARLRRVQPVILVYVRFDETTLRVVMSPEWKQAIESKALPGSLLHDLPIYESDLSPTPSAF
jgi:hypothetical protein